MAVKAGGEATSSFSAITLSTQQPDGSQSAGKDTQAIGLGESTELLLPARQTVAQPKPIWQETQASFGQVGAAQGDKNVRRLDPGKPTEQGLEGGQSYFYKIELAAGEYLRVEVDQRGIDVVADGVLQYLPFGALPAPTTEVGSGQSRAHGGQIPLIVQHEIVNLPSASTLALLRLEQNGRQPAAHQVAVLADPVFDRNDPRLKLDVEAQSAEGKNQSNSLADSQTTLRLRFGLERSAREVGVSFDRLRFSRREAEAIAALTREGERLKALDFAASRATALSEELGRYRIIHFATHGLLNSQHPELSGLVLSLVDERGQPQDGFLRAHEVYNLKLNADLVVLSGRRTALGKDVKGEGMVGLTRGFMYAGAPRVVASLWQVSDKATADLMKRFYKGILADGLRPAAALRAAQVAMWREKRAPYFWAAFVLQGEWH